jgi:hypothetical protein
VLPYTGMTNVDYRDYLGEQSSFELPLGSLIYQSSQSQALVITPGDSSRSLIGMGLANLDNGEFTPILGQATRHNEDYVIYDARAGVEAIIWVECNMVPGLWQVYAAPLPGGTVDPEVGLKAVVLDQGTIEYEPPLLAASGSKVYWTVMPDPNGPAYQEDSLLKCAQFGQPGIGDKPEPQTIYVSHGRMITNPQVSGDTLTIVPRVDSDNVYYQLTTLGIADDKVRDVAILPPSLRVSDAVWLDQGFAFCIDANYDYAQGLAYAGTYCQLQNGQYLYINKLPSQAPVRLGELLYIKSTKNVIGLDTARGNAVIVPTPSNGVAYGDIMAAAGNQGRLVLYTTVTSRLGQEKGNCQVRILDPI